MASLDFRPTHLPDARNAPGEKRVRFPGLPDLHLGLQLLPTVSSQGLESKHPRTIPPPQVLQVVRGPKVFQS